MNLTGLRGPEIELRSCVTLSELAFVSFLSLTASSFRISSCIGTNLVLISVVYLI